MKQPYTWLINPLTDEAPLYLDLINPLTDEAPLYLDLINEAPLPGLMKLPYTWI